MSPITVVLCLLALLQFGAAWNLHTAGRTGTGASRLRPVLRMFNAATPLPVPQQSRLFSLNPYYTNHNNLQKPSKWSSGRYAAACQQHRSRRQAVPEESADEGSVEASNNDPNNKGLFSRAKGYFLQNNKKDYGLTFKQRLAKMGVATVLSYGMISNLSYAILISLAWYGFSVQTGTTPLAPGQWKPFLGVYAGFWVFNNIVRPLRVGLSIAIAPSLDRLVLFFQNRLKVSKPLAITFTVVVVNVIGILLLMCGGISLASLCSGVAIFPPR